MASSAIEIAALCFLLVGSSVGLKCRSGFSTSVYNIPIEYWNTTECSSGNQQSCFLEELTYNVSVLGDLKFVFGSCVSQQYGSLLECDQLFGEGGIKPDTLLAILPNLQVQLETAIADFSQNTAQSVVHYLQNLGSDLYDIELIYSILTGANVPVPGNMRPSLKKLDALLLTLALNQTGATGALNEFLYSFSDLNTPDAAASKLLYDFFEGIDVSVPDMFKPLIENLPASLSLNFQDDPIFAAVNSTLFSILEGFSPAAQQSQMPLTQSDLDAILQLIPEEYGLHPFFNTLPKLASELQKQNFDYAQTWSLEVLKAYSKITPATEALSNATIDLLNRLGVNLTDDLIAMIKYQPGQIYQYFPNSTDIIDRVFQEIARGIASSSGTEEFDFEAILGTFMVQDFPGREDIVSLVNGLYETLVGGEFDVVGKFALEALKNVSVLTPESMALSEAILNFTARMNLTLGSEIQELIEYLPGLYIAIFPNNTDLINLIYSNITQNLGGPDFSISQIIQLISTSSGLDNVAELPGMDQISGLLEDFINIAGTGNLTEIAEFALEALKETSNVTEESTALSEAIIAFVEQMNVTIPEEVEEMLKYLPGIINVALPNNTDLVNLIFANITQGLMDAAINDPLAMTTASLEQLIAANILPEQVDILLARLPELVNALIANDTTTALSLLTEISEMYTLPETSASTALTHALRNLMAQIEGIGGDAFLDLGLEYLPRIPYALFPNQTELIDMIFNNITEGLMNVNLTNPTPGQMEEIFQSVDFSMIPVDLLPLVNYTQDLIGAIMRNDTDTVREIVISMQSMYCTSSEISEAFASALFDDLTRRGLVVQDEYKLVFECIPALTLAAFPNQTEMITDIFGQMILAYTNYTAYIESLLSTYNVALPSEVTELLALWPDIESILTAEGNLTDILLILQQYAAETTKETELSKLIITIMTGFGATPTPDQIISIRQSAMGFYNDGLANYTDMFDTIFASLDADIAAGKDLGLAFKDAFAKAGVEIPPRAIPVLDNIQPLIDAINATIANGDQNAINNAVLKLLEDYNRSFPSAQIQLQINQIKLQIVLSNVQDANIPDEAFEYLDNIYRLTLNVSNVTEDKLKELLITQFPTMEGAIEILFNLQPKEVFHLATQFVAWAADADRTPGTLAGYINSTIYILLDRFNIDLPTLLQTLPDPKDCKYEVCLTDNCNVISLSNPATTAPEPTTVPQTTPAQTTSTSTPRPTTKKPVTTTSAAKGMTRTVTSTMLLTSIVWSINMVLL